LKPHWQLRQDILKTAPVTGTQHHHHKFYFFGAYLLQYCQASNCLLLRQTEHIKAKNPKKR